MHHRVRVLRADLHRKVAVAARLVQLVARERGHGHQPRRSPPGQPEAVVEQRGPHADGDREEILRAPDRGDVRVHRSDTGRERPGPPGQVLQEYGQFLLVPAPHVVREERGEGLLRGEDARLMPPVERDAALVGGAGDAEVPRGALRAGGPGGEGGGTRRRRQEAGQAGGSQDERPASPGGGGPMYCVVVDVSHARASSRSGGLLRFHAGLPAAGAGEPKFIRAGPFRSPHRPRHAEGSPSDRLITESG
ncbi:hypothetical protein HEB29_000301 [Streptomyces fulvorobeus]|uniref:Uncharacterized protein n=1 Tax=Streptomyces fulvorobeus TaxID=284028 RepID=A0A7Y9H7F6_9ACTN|nr:hypothetical protein [Streptomyces fulvorobeus]